MNRFRERYNELRIELSVVESLLDDERRKAKKRADYLFIIKLSKRWHAITFIMDYCQKESDKIESIEGQGINEFLRMKLQARIKSALQTNKYEQEASTTIYR